MRKGWAVCHQTDKQISLLSFPTDCLDRRLQCHTICNIIVIDGSNMPPSPWDTISKLARRYLALPLDVLSVLA